MYYLPWSFLVVISLWVSVMAFIWAVKSGQFADQDRARYLPLWKESHLLPVKDPAKLSLEAYVLFAILGTGCTIFLWVLVRTLGLYNGV